MPLLSTAVTRLGLYGGPRANLAGYAVAGLAQVSGTVLGSLEADLVAGGKTLIIELTYDQWLPAGTEFNDQRQAIIDGITASASPTNGWNNEVRDNESVTSVERTSDTVVTITFTGAAGYNVSVAESVQVTVPGTALEGTEDIIATPSFSVGAQAGTRELYSFTSNWFLMND